MSQPEHRMPSTSPQAEESLGSYTDTDWDITTGVGFTALAVAAGRAMETARPDSLISDPQAARFVAAAQASVGLPVGWPPKATALANAAEVDATQLQQVWATMAAYMGVRSRHFDQELQSWCHDAGPRQVVLLAAGLDTRASRLGWPAETRIFEIDHPNVLAFKERVLTRQDVQPDCDRRPVGVDLREDWPTALRQAGFDPAVPTVWLAEGLLFYLPDAAKQQLARRVHGLSASGSRWAIESMADPATAMNVVRDDPVLHRVATHLGTDPTGLWPADQQWDPHGWLVRHGWTVTATSAHTAAARYQRVLEGPLPMLGQQHPSVLLSAALEHPANPVEHRQWVTHS